MNSIKNHFHSVFGGNIKDSKPKYTQNLESTLIQIYDPDIITKRLVYLIRKEEDKRKRSQLKLSLKSYTPAILCGNYRRIADILEFTGIMQIDFDGLPSHEYARELKQFIFDDVPQCYATWISSSGIGVRGIIHIDKAKDLLDYKSMFKSFYDDYITQYEFEQWFDPAPNNVVLPMFQSYDPDMLYRETAQIWFKRYIEAPIVHRNIPPIEGISDDSKRHAMNIVRKIINRIDGNGHPQNRGAARLLGGFVGAGYLDYHEAVQFIDDLIESNSYLSIKPLTYKKTAREMIQSGMKKPVYL